MLGTFDADAITRRNPRWRTRKSSRNATSARNTSPLPCSRRAGTSPRRCAWRSASPTAASSCAASCTRAASRRGPATSSTKPPNLPIAVIEAKDNNRSVGDGMQQGLNYAETLDVPFAISSNGDAFLVHDHNQSRRTDGPLRPPQGWPRRVPHAAGPPRRHVDRIRLAGCLKTGPKWGSTAAARKKATGTAAAFPGTRRRQSLRLQGGSGP